MKARKLFSLYLILITLSFGLMAKNEEFKIIPKPVSIEYKEGEFYFNSYTRIICPSSSKEYEVAEYLHEKLSNINPQMMPIAERRPNAKFNTDNSIIFSISSEKNLGKEGYRIDINPHNIVLSANENHGFFNGVQTLIQILDIYQIKSMPYNYSKTVSCAKIIDYPEYNHRGMHLDCARHFFTKEEVKNYLDILAMHKINKFHWHLTDDQGWRVEVKKYPKLHLVGSVRKETLIGHAHATPISFDDTPYGGYYTQEDIKEIVEYAKGLYIDIIPEIEMPGHSMAMISAYPNLSCREEPIGAATLWGVFDDVLCNKEEVIDFLKDVLDEIIPLFPYEYIHIGGDECPTVRWEECEKCNSILKEHNLNNHGELQTVFMNKIIAHVTDKGKKVIGWDEILTPTVDKRVTIMSWQSEQGGIDAAKAGIDAIMIPSSHLYLNYYQGKESQEPLAIGGHTTLKKVYHYNPMPSGLNREQAKHILGVQGAMWSEYIKTMNLLEYMLLPRLAAVSEIAWVEDGQKDYDEFLNRLDNLKKTYSHLGLNYSLAFNSIMSSTNYNKGINICLYSPDNKSEIYYTTDNSNPTRDSKRYDSPIHINERTIIKAIAYHEGKPTSPMFENCFQVNKATGRPYKMENINPNYSGSGEYPLTDGITLDKQNVESWVGTLGEDYFVELDLGKRTKFSKVSINFLDYNTSWIFAPYQVEFYYSNNGKNWKHSSTVNVEDVKQKNNIFTFVSNNNHRARYIKIIGRSVKTCPGGHPGHGQSSHCFADEITVE